jgi:hypothetical protein
MTTDSYDFYRLMEESIPPEPESLYSDQHEQMLGALRTIVNIGSFDFDFGISNRLAEAEERAFRAGLNAGDPLSDEDVDLIIKALLHYGKSWPWWPSKRKERWKLVAKLMAKLALKERHLEENTQ